MKILSIGGTDSIGKRDKEYGEAIFFDIRIECSHKEYELLHRSLLANDEVKLKIGETK